MSPGLRAPRAREAGRRATRCPGGALRAAGRLRLPSDLRATAVSAERLVFAAAPLTAAITLAPPRNPRGAERRGKSVASGESDSRALRRAVRGKTAPAPQCQAGKGKAGWTLGETAAREYDSVRTRDAFCAGPLSFCLLRAEPGVWPRGKSVPLRASSTHAGAAQESSMDLPWSRASGHLKGQNRGAHLLEATSRWCHVPKAFLIRNALQ